jgi:hypothetical protein
VFFVPLVSVDIVDAVISAIASALDLSFSGETNLEPERRDARALEVRLLNYPTGETDAVGVGQF